MNPRSVPETRARARIEGAVGVENVALAVRRHGTIVAPDYVDGFTLETPDAARHSPEAWARAILERAAYARRGARTLWTLIGLRLGPPRSPAHVQGWAIAARGEGFLRATTASFYLKAEVVFLVQADRVTISLSLRYDRPWLAAAVWSRVAGPHQRAVPIMLRQAAEILALE